MASENLKKSMDFTGKVVIVTGGSSGIGAASAVLFAKQGAAVTIVGRNEERLRDIANKCHNARGVVPLIVNADLTDRGSCEEVVCRTISTYGRIDVLVNCAGKLIIGSLFDENIDTFDELIDLNLRVPIKLTHLAAPHLTKTKGNIVNILGSKYTRVRHGFLPFSIAKAGLDKFTKSAAIELASVGVRINSVQPGLTRTKILSNMTAPGEEECVFEHLRGMFPTNEILQPQEVARMVVLAASDLCPNMNGASLDIHGASCMM